MEINKDKQNGIPFGVTTSLGFIHNCYYRNLGEINSWWEYLKPYLEQSLEVYKEIALLNSKEKGGEKLVDLLRKEIKNSQTEINDILDTNIVVVFINENQNISKIEILEAKPDKESQVEVMLKEYNGILRVNG